MCEFCSDLPKQSRSSEFAKRKNIMMFLKPNKDKEFYRFRLLNFKSPTKNNRDYPFIERWVHQHWGKNDKGNNVVDDTVVCLVTKFVDYKGDKYKDCPCCNLGGANWTAYKTSGKTDKNSAKRGGELKRSYQAIVPVFVVSDPNNEKNNGRLKTFMFTDKDEYKSFIELINIESSKAKVADTPYKVFNGKNAVDICLRMENVEKLEHAGEPNEYRHTVRKITKMTFTKTPYDLPGITKEAIDDFPFDDQYYVTNTIEELEDYCKRHYGHASSQIPDEDVNIFGEEDRTERVSVRNEAKTAEPTPVAVPDDIDLDAPSAPSVEADPLATDPDDLPPPSEEKKDDTINEQSIDALISELA